MLIGDETSSQCGTKMRDAKAGVNVRLIEIIVPVVVGSMICAALGVVLFPRYLSSPLLSPFFSFFSFFFALLLRLALLFSLPLSILTWLCRAKTWWQLNHVKSAQEMEVDEFKTSYRPDMRAETEAGVFRVKF